jgi:cytochrome c553
MRQLLDMKTGARRGPWAAMMMPVLERMSVAEMTAIVAYAASLDPSGASITPGQ